MRRARPAGHAVQAALFGLASLLFAPSAQASSWFSPGGLSQAHAHLEGLANCSQCHTSQQGVDRGLCLTCHQDVAGDQKASRGLHGSRAQSAKACESCHHEHLGFDANIAGLAPTGNGFDHNSTGYALVGKHQPASCTSCHRAAFMAPDSAGQTSRQAPIHSATQVANGPLLAGGNQPKMGATGDRMRYRGLSTTCSSCHADIHRGQFASGCDTCHTPASFVPAAGFAHDTSQYPLRGKHKQVACSSCHKSVAADQPLPKGLLGSNSARYVQYSPVAHQSCTDCHQDVHRGTMQGACTDCHTTSSWLAINERTADRTFHQKTAYPLEGAHAQVACKSCHGPTTGRPAAFSPLPHARCSDCHADAHEGQLAKGGFAQASCGDCHSLTSFADVRFDEADHRRTRYPLRGAHKVVACNACHKRDPGLARHVSAKSKRQAAKEQRPLVFSLTKLLATGPTKRCDTCHQTPHGEQFCGRIDAKGCADCHKTSAFDRVRFDHNTESRFALDGAHAKASCQSCHQQNSGPAVYEGLASDCSSCHRDVHAQQFVAASGAQVACSACHTTAAFKPSTYAHPQADAGAAPLAAAASSHAADAGKGPAAPRTEPPDKLNSTAPAARPEPDAFVLAGKHRLVACNACHRTVSLSGTHISAVQYKMPHERCEQCHTDQHQGALDRLPLVIQNKAIPRPDGQVPRCITCHTQSGWLPTAYKPHARFAFKLEGGHADVACRACHKQDFSPIAKQQCGSCHQDVHAGEFGAQCSACHQSANWQADFDVWAHRMTNFPLRGAHGAIPCQDCHPGAYANQFRGTAITCDGCHQSDYQKTALSGVNHVASNFSANCRSCHEPWQWQRAVFPQHEACFPIASGAHANIGCSACHTSLVGAVANGRCATGTATCTSCHTHAPEATSTHHVNVAGYRYDDRGCQSCHGRGQ